MAGKQGARGATTGLRSGGPSAAENGNRKPTLDSISGYLLRRAHYLYYTYWVSRFRPGQDSITPMQSGMLTMLRQHPAVTQAELARRVGVEVPTAFKALKRLEEGGYIERINDNSDKRVRALRLTAVGVRILDEIDAFNRARDDDILADFTPEERRQLSYLLTKLIVRGVDQLGMSQEVVTAAPADVNLPVAADAPPETRKRPRGVLSRAGKIDRISRWRSQSGLRKKRSAAKM